MKTILVLVYMYTVQYTVYSIPGTRQQHKSKYLQLGLINSLEGQWPEIRALNFFMILTNLVSSFWFYIYFILYFILYFIYVIYFPIYSPKTIIFILLECDLPPLRPQCGEAPGRDTNPGQAI